MAPYSSRGLRTHNYFHSITHSKWEVINMPSNDDLLIAGYEKCKKRKREIFARVLFRSPKKPKLTKEDERELEYIEDIQKTFLEVFGPEEG